MNFKSICSYFDKCGEKMCDNDVDDVRDDDDVVSVCYAGMFMLHTI